MREANAPCAFSVLWYGQKCVGVMLVWNVLLVRQKTGNSSDDEQCPEIRSGLTENRSCREAVYTTRLEAVVVLEVNPIHLQPAL